jgi:hypothetical protein
MALDVNKTSATLTPTYPIAGEADWILAVVELPKAISHAGQHRSIPHFLSQDLNTVRPRRRTGASDLSEEGRWPPARIAAGNAIGVIVLHPMS